MALTLWGCDADEPTAGNPNESRESRMAPTPEASDHADTAKDRDSFETDLTREPNYKVDYIDRWTNLVSDDHVERWPQDESPPGCG